MKYLSKWLWLNATLELQWTLSSNPIRLLSLMKGMTRTRSFQFVVDQTFDQIIRKFSLLAITVFSKKICWLKLGCACNTNRGKGTNHTKALRGNVLRGWKLRFEERRSLRIVHEFEHLLSCVNWLWILSETGFPKRLHPIDSSGYLSIRPSVNVILRSSRIVATWII